MSSIKFKSSGVKTGDPNLIKEVSPSPAGIKTPISLGSTGRSGIFEMYYNQHDQVTDNLKNLVLTNWGERLGNYYYGANLRSLTTEVTAQEDFEQEAMIRIQTAVRNFMPYVELEEFNSTFDISVNPDDSIHGVTVISLTIRYNVPTLRMGTKALQVKLYCIG
ncbi:hypothetical protein CL634_07985 [bacterium]|nr:hypothetical protein [bacterium]